MIAWRYLSLKYESPLKLFIWITRVLLGTLAGWSKNPGAGEVC